MSDVSCYTFVLTSVALTITSNNNRKLSGDKIAFISWLNHLQWSIIDNSCCRWRRSWIWMVLEHPSEPLSFMHQMRQERLDCLTYADGDSTILRNVGNHSLNDIVSHSRRPSYHVLSPPYQICLGYLTLESMGTTILWNIRNHHSNESETSK